MKVGKIKKFPKLNEVWPSKISNSVDVWASFVK